MGQNKTVWVFGFYYSVKLNYQSVNEEIAFIIVSDHLSGSFLAMTRPSDKGWPYDSKDIVSQCKVTKLEKMDNERALLGFFLANFFRIDPDLVVGHDLSGFILDILLHRIIYNKTPHWSRLGRLKRTNPPQAGKVSTVWNLYVLMVYSFIGTADAECHGVDCFNNNTSWLWVSWAIVQWKNAYLYLKI